MEEHAIPKEAYDILRPLQIEMAELRNKAREAERGVMIGLKVALAMMGLDPEKPYVLSDKGDKVTLSEGDKKE